MKRGVNAIVRGKLQSITHLVYPPQDFKWPHTLRHQLPAGQAEGQVSGLEPDPVPRCEHGALTAVLVSALLLPLPSQSQRFLDGFPGVL